MSDKKKQFNTICVQENTEIETGHSHILPINSSSAFSFKNIEESIKVFTKEKPGYVYTRYANPTIDSFVFVQYCDSYLKLNRDNSHD